MRNGLDQITPIVSRVYIYCVYVENEEICLDQRIVHFTSHIMTCAPIVVCICHSWL